MKTSYNFAAILVSAIASFGLGFLWFTILFKTPYLTDLGKTPEEMNRGASGPQAMILQVIGNLVLAFVMAWLIKKLGYQTINQGLMLGFLLWLGFVVAVIGPIYAFQAFSFRFFLINAGGVLTYFLTSAVIISGWK